MKNNPTQLTFLQSYIREKLVEENKKRDATHKSSGKLSASMLGMPMQWNILKHIGVPPKDFDGYTLSKFASGKVAEKWLAGYTPGLIKEQRFVEYKDTVGYADYLVDMAAWNLPDLGKVPCEAKSISMMDYKWSISKSKKAKGHHLKQAGFYGVGEGAEYFVVIYIIRDDFRVLPLLYKTADIKKEVDKEIDTFYKLVKKGIVPEFEPTEGWTDNDDYNNYLEFKELTQKEIKEKLKNEYPESYKKLKGGVAND